MFESSLVDRRLPLNSSRDSCLWSTSKFLTFVTQEHCVAKKGPAHQELVCVKIAVYIGAYSFELVVILSLDEK